MIRVRQGACNRVTCIMSVLWSSEQLLLQAPIHPGLQHFCQTDVDFLVHQAMTSCVESVVPLPTAPQLLAESQQTCLLPSFAAGIESEVFVSDDDAAYSALTVQPPLFDALDLVTPYAPQQEFSGVLSLMHPRMSTPTMHPNLVTTLKSIISPPVPSSCIGPQELVLACSENDASYIQTCTFPDCEVSEIDAFQMQQVDSPQLHTTRQDSHKIDKYQDEEIAVVPVDLIQNRRPVRCIQENCNKTFKNQQTMKMHLKTHKAEEAASRLGAHSLSSATSSLKAGHNKKIPSRCPVCKQTFVGLYELRRHFGRKHLEGEKRYACQKCGKKFYIEVDLRDHEKLCGETIKCKCGLKFAFRCNLVAHKKGHPECKDHQSEEDTISVA